MFKAQLLHAADYFLFCWNEYVSIPVLAVVDGFLVCVERELLPAPPVVFLNGLQNYLA